MLHTLVYFASLCITIQGFILVQDTPRNVVKILAVDNGGRWGDWHGPQFCAEGSFAVGYTMKIESDQGGDDDTALNSILLRCESVKGSHFAGDVGSGQGAWGDWTGWSRCNNTAGIQDFLTAFSLQVESYQGPHTDDTMANYVKFMCRDLKASRNLYELAYPPGRGHWGSYCGWSEICPINSAICGIQTRIEKPQGHEDDSALNDVKFFCCT